MNVTWNGKLIVSNGQVVRPTAPTQGTALDAFAYPAMAAEGVRVDRADASIARSGGNLKQAFEAWHASQGTPTSPPPAGPDPDAAMHKALYPSMNVK